jgi:hypothetical protein
MACKVGWIWRSGFGSLLVRAAAFSVLVSVAPPPVGSDDAARTAGGAPRSVSGARVRLREGVSPQALEAEGAGAEAIVAGWSDQGLEEQAGTTAAGGTTVQLRGRFRSSVVLTRDGHGATSSQCIANLPAEGRRD